MNGFLIAAPHSGSGKTLVTLAMLRALAKRGSNVVSAKAGPDYIDPAFHRAASGQTCINLDPWAMGREHLSALASQHAVGSDVFVVEGMMGLFDGAADGSGSAADLSQHLTLPIVLVVDCSRMSQSIGALVSGYFNHRHGLSFAGVVLNRVGSARHEGMLRAALLPLDVPVLGVVRSDSALSLPSRHLGLVQAGEHGALEAFIERAATAVEEGMDFDLLETHTRIESAFPAGVEPFQSIRPLGQRIAIARDEAFSFLYPHLEHAWRNAGAEISFFSPLADQPPAADVDAVYLPGGYPELHAGRIAGANAFRSGMHQAKDRGALIYGECGGYMVLGKTLIDADGGAHAMLGMLNLTTRFDERKRQLGYRRIEALHPFPPGRRFRGHEFHYSVAAEQRGDRLFAVTDATGQSLGEAGLRNGNVFGSYMHLIDVDFDGVNR